MRLIRKLQALLVTKAPELKEFEKRLHYIFSHPYYLEKAITHRSEDEDKGKSNALNYLFKKYPQSDEGTLTKKRASLVNRGFLAMLGQNLGVMDVLRIEQGVNINDPKVALNISADVYEAVVGAIFLDGGIKEASAFIKRTLCLSEHLAHEDQNYKGQLIEYCHKKNLPAPNFTITKSHGPEHEKTFIIKVAIDQDNSWVGIGSTKKSAEQDGAQRAINFLLGS